MKTKFYIKTTQSGKVSVSKNRPYVNMDEVAIGVTMELPDVLFKRPQIEASITVNADDVQPFEIDADTSNAVKEAIQQSTGFEVKITVVNPESELQPCPT